MICLLVFSIDDLIQVETKSAAVAKMEKSLIQLIKEKSAIVASLINA